MKRYRVTAHRIVEYQIEVDANSSVEALLNAEGIDGPDTWEAVGEGQLEMVRAVLCRES